VCAWARTWGGRGGEDDEEASVARFGLLAAVETVNERLRPAFLPLKRSRKLPLRSREGVALPPSLSLKPCTGEGKSTWDPSLPDAGLTVKRAPGGRVGVRRSGDGFETVIAGPSWAALTVAPGGVGDVGVMDRVGLRVAGDAPPERVVGIRIAVFRREMGGFWAGIADGDGTRTLGVGIADDVLIGKVEQRALRDASNQDAF
jgi:hypothetical protein